MNRTLRSVACGLVYLVLSPAPAAAQVPVEFQGDWVAAQSACDAPVRFRVEAAKLTLLNGADSQSFGDVEMAGPAYWGPDYKGGIEAVAFAEFSGDQPVIATFNASGKKGVAQLEFGQPTPGPGPALAALNARYQKLNLVKRFPINKVPLKKCPARGK
jgi:hypothetical protein